MNTNANTNTRVMRTRARTLHTGTHSRAKRTPTNLALVSQEQLWGVLEVTKVQIGLCPEGGQDPALDSFLIMRHDTTVTDRKKKHCNNITLILTLHLYNVHYASETLILSM